MDTLAKLEATIFLDKEEQVVANTNSGILVRITHIEVGPVTFFKGLILLQDGTPTYHTLHLLRGDFKAEATAPLSGVAGLSETVLDQVAYIERSFASLRRLISAQEA